jgi:hypothetical protein
VRYGESRRATKRQFRAALAVHVCPIGIRRDENDNPNER